MMPSGSRMGREDFDQALANAVAGLIVTDQGADDRTNDALTAIALLGNSPSREAEARAAFAATQ